MARSGQRNPRGTARKQRSGPKRPTSGGGGGGGGGNPLSVAFTHLYWVGGPRFQALGLADGGSVTSWPDEIATLPMPLNGSPSQVYRATDASLNNNKAIDWTSTTNSSVVVSFTQAIPNSIVVICKWDVIAGYVVDGFDSTHRRIIRPVAGPQWSHYCGVDAAGGVADTTKHGIVSKISSTVAGVLKVDGVTVTTAGLGTHTMTGLRIGADSAGTNDFDGHVALVGVYNGDVETDPNWSLFQAWALAQYGVTF